MRPAQQFLLTLVFCLFSAQALAGAWTQAPGKALFINTLTYYQASRYYDNVGSAAYQPHYHKAELMPYVEYGLKDWLTLGGSVALQYAAQKPEQNFAIADSEFFARARLWQGEGLVVSVAPLVKLPRLTSHEDAPVLGGAHPDVGLTLSAGYGFAAFGRHHFANIDTSYRHRFGPSQDQWRVDATLGLRVSDEVTLMPQAFLTRRASKGAGGSFTQSSGDDYDDLNLQFSVLYELREDVTLQLGAFEHVQGRNAGKGSGVVFALWKRF